MSSKYNKKFGIRVDRQPEGWWSFGMCFSHIKSEDTYLYINFFKWSITVGLIYQYSYLDEEDDLK